jgi:hypothetical protein
MAAVRTRGGRDQVELLEIPNNGGVAKTDFGGNLGSNGVLTACVQSQPANTILGTTHCVIFCRENTLAWNFWGSHRPPRTYTVRQVGVGDSSMISSTYSTLTIQLTCRHRPALAISSSYDAKRSPETPLNALGACAPFRV